MSLYRCIPQYKVKPWGGDYYKNRYKNDEIPENTGEIWLFSPYEGSVSYLEDVMGERKLLTDIKEGDTPNILIKFLDVNETTSVQVHPNKEYTLTHEGTFEKNEAWYVLNANKGSKIIYGLKNGIGSNELKDYALNGGESIFSYVNAPMREEIINVPVGTVHALGAGIAVYEVQQSSDTTFRLYDWGRDNKGGTRPLHIEESLESTDFSAKYTKTERKEVTLGKETGEEFMLNEHFRLIKAQMKEAVAMEYSSWCVVTVIDGECDIICADEKMHLNAGECAALSQNGKAGGFKAEGKATLLIAEQR